MARHMDLRARKRSRSRALGVAAAVLVATAVGLAVALWPRSSGVESQKVSAAEGELGATAATEAPAAPAPASEGSSAPNELVRMLRDHEVASMRLIGDSITAGYGVDNYEDANIFGEGRVIYDDGEGSVYYETPASVHCWANELRAYATERGVGDFVNAGINGAFMARLAEHPDAWLGEGADVVFVALGTNDAGYVGPDEYRASAEAGLAAAASKSKLVVVLSPVSDLRPLSTLVESAASLGDVLRDICEREGYLFVDMRDAVAPELFNDDGLHPTSQGSLAMWQTLRDALSL